MNTKVICIDHKPNPSERLPLRVKEELTFGKEYTLLLKEKLNGLEYCVVKNNRGNEEYYYSSRFITVEEWRNKQLIKIGI